MSASFRESDFIAWATAGGAPELPVGPGDDAAVLADGRVLCMDATVEGSHFAPGTAPELVVRKALGRALSDLCAMGAQPETVHVAALLPPGSDGRALAAALAHWSRAFGVALAGGDTKRSPSGCLAFAVAASGRCDGAPWLRSGGRPGDRLCVTGPLGGAAAGRHLRVAPRMDVVQLLRERRVPVHACLDLSDGLGRNLRQLCEASRCGAEVQAARIPVHADVAPGRDGVQAALLDGEDFELLLALAPDAAVPPLVEIGPVKIGLVEIGALTEDPALWLRHAAGEAPGARTPWPRGGYEHEF